MKLVRLQKSPHGARSYVFQLSKNEMDWLVTILRFFPQRESPCYKITKGGAKELNTAQTLLNDALSQQRAEHERKLEKFLASPDRFRAEAPDQFRLVLTSEQLEWMLQVLNEVRVGCWMKLGSPELEKRPDRDLTPDEGRLMAALELCGFFQMVLLGAWDGAGEAA
jgi:hypothetical protein